MSILLYLGTRGVVHCQTPAAGSVYTTILTAAVPGVWRHNNPRRVCVMCAAHTRTKRRAACLRVFVCDAAHPDDKSCAPNNDTDESTVTDDLSPSTM